MGEVHDLDAHRPHFRVQGGPDDGAKIVQYVFPVQLAYDIAGGKALLNALETAVWQTIIRQWADYMTTQPEPPQ